MWFNIWIFLIGWGIVVWGIRCMMVEFILGGGVKVDGGIFSIGIIL